MTALEAPRKPRMPVVRCPFCVEGGNFKAMIGRSGAETWYIGARCQKKNRSAASRQYSHFAALWMSLTLPYAPLPRRCVFDPWVLGASVGSKLCGELRFERPLHFI